MPRRGSRTRRLRANAPTFVPRRRLRANAPNFIPSVLRRTIRSSQKVVSNTYNALWKEIRSLTVGK